MFDNDILSKWIKMYQQASFKLCSFETEGEGLATLTYGLELFELEDTFDLSNSLMPIVKQWNADNNTNFKYTDMYRAHVNLFGSNDVFDGHTDYPDERGLVTLWFGNPYFEESGGGFTLGEEEQFYIENKFNRCIMFPGNLWHKVEHCKLKNSVRLTLYIGFRTDDSNNRTREFSRDRLYNLFDRDGSKSVDIAKQLHKDFGIGN